MIRSTSIRLLSGFLVAALLLSGTAVSAQTVPQFKDGDRVCFVGDSITHGGSYHSDVYLYYLTRFPDLEFRVWNKGISGDRAQDVLDRFERDVASVKPTVSTLMLGMNDVGRWLYGRDKTGAAAEQAQQGQLDTYARKMTTLLDRFAAIGSEVILLTPSIYDQTGELPSHNNYGVNDGLGQCANFVRQMAESEGQGVVDFHDAMSAINLKVQSTNNSATIVGPDRVHPKPDPGHFIMAYLFLKAQGVPRLVSKMALDAKTGKVITAENALVSEMEVSEDSVSFTALEGALPFPQTDSIREGLNLVPFTEEMNQEILTIRNLAPGEYLLTIDGETCGTWSALDFSKGINLAENDATPQYVQALKVKKLNDTRRYHQSRLRDAAFTLYKSGLYASDVNLEDLSAIAAYLSGKLEKVEDKPWHGYYKKNFDTYLSIQPKIGSIHAELDSLHSKLYQANQPEPHQFVITRQIP